MGKTMTGVVVGLATWLASAMAANAQVGPPTSEPTDPTAVYSSDTTSTFGSDVTLVTPSFFFMKLWVYLNDTLKHYSSTYVPNPGSTSYHFTKLVNMSSWGHGVGDELKYKSQLIVAGVPYDAADWYVTVSYGARPGVGAGKMSFAPVAAPKDLWHEE